MSPSPSSGNESPTAFVESELATSLGRYSTGLKTGVTGVAFWTAVILPFLHLPLLLTGLEQPSTQAAFVGLLALNVLAAVLGQSYRRD